jgi:hypothetical protein
MDSAQLAHKFDQEWSAVTKLAASHPKTTIIACLLIGLVIGHLV